MKVFISKTYTATDHKKSPLCAKFYMNEGSPKWDFRVKEKTFKTKRKGLEFSPAHCARDIESRTIHTTAATPSL